MASFFQQLTPALSPGSDHIVAKVRDAVHELLGKVGGGGGGGGLGHKSLLKP